MPTLEISVPEKRLRRKLQIGADVQVDGGVHFRLWAPYHREVALVLFEQKSIIGTFALEKEREGYFSLFLPMAKAGLRYGFRLDSSDQIFPDPASRYQPDGPFGLSEITDPTTFRWTDQDWLGCETKGQVIYELHIGTFTKGGTWAAATEQLEHLRDLGVTLIEMMPVAEFDGEFGWGYDGVNLFAPFHLYGRPDDLRRFVDQAHRRGIGVILDVVYNHLGPSGNFLKNFSADYFTDRYQTDWGEAINYDGKNARSVREFFLENARYWLEEFHFDGLRIDATQCIYDQSKTHILAEMSRYCRDAVKNRKIILVAENEPQLSQAVEPIDQGGYGLDMMWNDDFHHAWRVALTGKREAYYSDYRGTSEELALLAKWGFLYQGCYNVRQGKTRGVPSLSLASESRVVFLQNHDQVANSMDGRRLHQMTSLGRHRAATMALLLLPGTPLLFQGQEFDSSVPFLYFAQHSGRLAELVDQGRRFFLSQFPSLAGDGAATEFQLPHEHQTLEICRLDLAEREVNQKAFNFHRDLIRLKKSDPVLLRQEGRDLAVTTLSREAVAFRYFGDLGDERLLVVNLGSDLTPELLHPNPVLMPPLSKVWNLVIASEWPKYGGTGIAAANEHGEWTYLAQSAYFFSTLEMDSL